MLSLPKTETVPTGHFDSEMLLGALLFAVLAVDPGMHIRFLNTAAEQFFGLGQRPDGPSSRRTGPAAQSFVVPISSTAWSDQRRRIRCIAVFSEGKTRNLAITAAPLVEVSDLTVVSLHEQTIARRINSQIAHRNAARSVTGWQQFWRMRSKIHSPVFAVRPSCSKHLYRGGRHRTDPADLSGNGSYLRSGRPDGPVLGRRHRSSAVNIHKALESASRCGAVSVAMSHS